MSITQCPCCGWSDYKVPPENEDDAVMACQWCTVAMDGTPHLCATAEEIARRVNVSENHPPATISKD
jgi:hypothetical protein